MKSRLIFLFVMVSVALFGFSLASDGFYIDRPSNPRAWSPGWCLLLIGWVTLIDGVVAWFANPLIAVSWMLIWLRSARVVALCAALSALLLSLSFLLHSEIMTDEGGGRTAITGYGSGYWLWVSSMAVMAIGTLIAAAGRSLDSQNDVVDEIER